MTTAHATHRPVPLDAARHPGEYSRMLLALGATTIVFGGAGVLVVGSSGWIALAALAGVLLLALGSA